MSNIQAKVTEIQGYQNLHIVKFDFYKHTLIMMSLELDPSIKIGTKVELSIKSTAISIAKGKTDMLSHSNQINATIKHIDSATLLSNITLSLCNSITVESIITKDAQKRLNLKIDEDVVLLIKANDISIARVLDD
jgi:molybdopterin-binding protein